MRKTFDAELLELGRELTEMAATAQDAIDLVTSSLSKGEEDGAKAAIALTATMDQMEKDIENHCMSLLMRQQPVARDLRAISTALKMVTDLQRIGDQAANIAEISVLMAGDGEKTDILRVDEGLMAVLCPAGENTLDFVYQPDGIRLGKPVTLLSLVVFVFYTRYFAWDDQKKRKH